MEVVVCHNNADFDSLGCLTAAKILRPKALACFPSRINKSVRELYSLYKDELGLTAVEHIDIQKVTHLCVTDTQNPERIGKFKKIFGEPHIKLTIIDHHPREANLPQGANLHIEEVGAATTILAEEILKQNLTISPSQATVLATAIYADTGCLTTQNTTPRDALVVAHLLKCGANLAVVGRYAKGPLNNGQRSLFEELLSASRTLRVNDASICLTSCTVADYVEGLAQLTTRLAEIEDCDASVAVVTMDDRVHITARSTSDRIDLLGLLEPYGGKGHPQAASATVKGEDPEKILENMEKMLPKVITPAVKVRDVMKSPVRTVDPDTTMEDAGNQMLRSGHSGLPVMRDGNLLGIISRRDLDKANHHGLQRAPVKGFMSTHVVTIDPDASVEEAQRIMVTRDIGRLPAVDSAGALVGIVTRTDMLRMLHGHNYPHWYQETYRVVADDDNLQLDNITHLIEDRLGNKGVGLLLLIGQEAERLGGRAFLVGGMVRDMLISYDNYDVDIVVEPEAIPLAKSVAKLLNAECIEHPQFATATLRLANGEHIDFATARTEFYVAPAAMPDVELATIRQDLYRRDFTINTLAVSLSPSSFGSMLDFFGGRSDIRSGTVRVLYNLSFVEDPTRILRAIRFEQRYGFRIEDETERFMHNALENNLLEKVSRERLRDELVHILSEPAASKSILRMDQLGILKHLISPDLVLTDRQIHFLRQISRLDLTGMDHPTLYLMVLLLYKPIADWSKAAEALKLSKRTRDTIEQVAETHAKVKSILENSQAAPSDLWELVEPLYPESRLFCALLTDKDAWDKIVGLIRRGAEYKALTGKDLLRHGLNPGPLFGQVLKQLKKARIDGVINTPEEELEMLNNLMSKWTKGGQ